MEVEQNKQEMLRKHDNNEQQSYEWDLKEFTFPLKWEQKFISNCKEKTKNHIHRHT